MKKWLAMLLCILMLLSVLPAAIAEEDAPAEEPALTEDEPIEDALTEPEEDADEEMRGTLKINAGNFPDENFRNWIKANLSGGADVMTSAEVNAVKTINCNYAGIASLQGISRFPNLEYLYCSHNALTELLLNSNKKLLAVECDHNQITKISMSACKELFYLQANDNKLASLNMSYNKKLQEVYLQNNQLAKLNVESNPLLEVLNVENNQIEAMKFIKNPKLRVLNISNNKFKRLGLTKNTVIEDVYADRNKLAELDLSNNPKLVNLSVSRNDLSALDVTKTPELRTLVADFNKLKSIDVTKCPKLRKLNVNENNSIKKLDVTKNPDLKQLECEGNQIAALDVTKCTKLTELNACGNSLKVLDVSKNTELEVLAVYDNRIGALDVTKLTKLQSLDLASNEVAALNVANCKDLTYLDCGNNRIRGLNLSANTKLVTLYCQCNQLEFLELGSCTELETLECSSNHIRALHLTNNTALKNPKFSNQYTTDALALTYSGGKYQFNMKTLFESDVEAGNVKAFDSSYSYNAGTGVMTMPGNVTSFKYKFNTGKGDMTVVVNQYYTGDFTVEFRESAVQYKGTTPYVIYSGGECCPDFAVKKSNGQILDPDEGYYEAWYTDNVNPGTGVLHVRMRGGAEKTLWFKIYLPATASTSVENVSAGIRVVWAKVDGATGYVIYRRAWSATTNGWTSFERWNNTTDTEWTDTAVYAGTRYQYGVKAYYSDPMDNYNLGLVGPLKTTVRITTRTLNSVTGGDKRLTAKWSGSKNFTGYEVQIATDAAFTQNVKTVKIAKASTYETTIKSLKANTTYYVRVRSYHIFDSITYYGQWSNVLSCKTN